MQPYLYHLTPLKNWVNTSPTIFLLHPGGMSERSLLLCIWAILRVLVGIVQLCVPPPAGVAAAVAVLVGVVLPCSYVYHCQLASRRLWRREVLRREELRRWLDGDKPEAEFGAGMRLLPVWKLYVPHIVLVLIAATAAGHNLGLVACMF
ncbi:g5903 [Coccomyxa elongata]